MPPSKEQNWVEKFDKIFVEQKGAISGERFVRSPAEEIEDFSLFTSWGRLL